MHLIKRSLSALIILMIWVLPSLSSAQQIDPMLKELIQKGVNKSHTVNIHALDASLAKEDQNLAKATLLPKITLNGSYTRLNDDLTFDEETQNLLLGTQKLLIKEAVGVPFNSPYPEEIPLTAVPNIQDQNILKSSIDLDWVVFSGLQVSNAIQASEHKEASIQYLGNAEEDKIALQVMEMYDKLALVHASQSVLTTSKNYLEEQEYYVKKAIENGLATPIARKKIELAQQQLASKELEVEHNKTLIIEVLHQLTGESRESLSITRPQLDPYDDIQWADNSKRYEVRALEEAEQATLYKSKMEKNDFIPKVAIKGHYEILEGSLSLLDPKWYVGVGVKWNIFDGNQAKIKSNKSLIESQKYREKINEAEEMIDLSIVQSQLKYEAAQENTKLAQKEIDLAKATYEMVNKQYRNDLASINDVLDVLNDLEKAYFNLQETYYDQRRAMAELLHAKGILENLYK